MAAGIVNSNESRILAVQPKSDLNVKVTKLNDEFGSACICYIDARQLVIHMIQRKTPRTRRHVMGVSRVTRFGFCTITRFDFLL